MFPPVNVNRISVDGVLFKFWQTIESQTRRMRTELTATRGLATCGRNAD